jgi:flagella basal body P-ring formation protein FlgA
LVSWQQVVGRVPSDALTEQTDLSLFEANRTLVSGELLRRSNVQLAPAIRKDEEITVTLRRGALTVETQLIAMENGAIGDEIIVINKDSGRELRARVTGVRRMELL